MGPQNQKICAGNFLSSFYRHYTFSLSIHAIPCAIARENISDLLLDVNTTYVENDSESFDELHKRSSSMRDLLGGMVDIVFHKYSIAHGDKLTFAEFCDFVREDESVQRFVWQLPACLGLGGGDVD